MKTNAFTSRRWIRSGIRSVTRQTGCKEERWHHRLPVSQLRHKFTSQIRSRIFNAKW